MSGDKVIASLVGKLRFDADYSGLLKFEKLLDGVASKMAQLEKQAQRLQGRLNIKAPGGAASNASHASRMREFKMEKALAQAKRQTFKEELAAAVASGKLQYANQKQQDATLLSSLKTKQQLAVLDEKAARAQQAQLKAAGIAQKNASSMEASKTRQARLEKLLAAQQSKTAQARTRELQQMTSLQRAEIVLQQLRADGARKVAHYNEQRAAQQQAQAKRQQTQQVAEQRRTEKFNQSQQRFQWAQQRQQHWQANKASPSSPGFGIGAGFDVAAIARAHPAMAAIAGIGTALALLEQRIKDTVTRVGKAEEYDLVLEQSGGKNKENQKFARAEFLRIAEKYGTSVDIDSAKDFRTNVMTATSGGKMSLDAAIKQYETQQAAFRGAGMNREEQQRALIQLRQVRAKGMGDTEDYKTFLEAAPLLGDAIGQAWAQRTGFKGETKDTQGAVLKAIPKGGLLAEDFNKALATFVRNNQDAIDKQSASIAAAQQRAENDRFLQQQNIDQSAELKKAIQERIAAERELTKAMQPVNEALAKFDTAVTSASASLLNFFFKSPDVKKLENDVTQKQKVVDSLKEKGLKPSHPAFKMAQDNLQDAQRELLDKRLKDGTPIDGAPVPKYLTKDGAGDDKLSPLLQRGLDKMLQAPQPFLPTTDAGRTANTIQQLTTNNTNNNATVNNVKFEMSVTANGTDPKAVVSEIELKIQDMATKAADALLHKQLAVTRQTLLETIV